MELTRKQQPDQFTSRYSALLNELIRRGVEEGCWETIDAFARDIVVSARTLYDYRFKGLVPTTARQHRIKAMLERCPECIKSIVNFQEAYDELKSPSDASPTTGKLSRSVPDFEAFKDVAFTPEMVVLPTGEFYGIAGFGRRTICPRRAAAQGRHQLPICNWPLSRNL